MIKVTLQRNLIGLEDLLIGVGTVQQVRGPASSDPITITKINGANLPYDGTYSMQEKFDELQGQIDSLPIVVDGDGNLLTGAIDSSSSDISGTHAARLWRRTIDANEARIYWGDQLILKYNPTLGGIIIPDDTDYIAADAVVTAAFQAADADIITDYIAADAVVTAAFEAADTALQDQIDDLTSDIGALSSVPIGSMVWVPYDTPDTDWKECNGQAISRTTYSALYAKIGTNYGVGDGSTTFNLPDVRGEFIRGWDNSRGIDTGRTIGSAQAAAFAAHSHAAGTLATDSSGSHKHDAKTQSSGSSGKSRFLGTSNGDNGGSIDVLGSEVYNIQAAGAHTHTISGSTSSVGGTETRPRNIAFMMQIKVL